MFMNIEEIRRIPITDFLALAGHAPKRQRGDECWYLAPYREERTASFQVNIRKMSGTTSEPDGAVIFSPLQGN